MEKFELFMELGEKYHEGIGVGKENGFAEGVQRSPVRNTTAVAQRAARHTAREADPEGVQRSLVRNTTAVADRAATGVPCS